MPREGPRYLWERGNRERWVPQATPGETWVLSRRLPTSGLAAHSAGKTGVLGIPVAAVPAA
eukprot:8277083-Alexandrium_andersonii.AAC.1